MNIRLVINEALKKTVALTISKPQLTNAQRSARWIEFLNLELVEHFPKGKGYRVFSRGNTKEILYDITVYEQFTVLSARRKTPLDLPKRCLWQIESELEERNSRLLSDDLGKLVLGAAENKLFVTSNNWWHNNNKRKWVTSTASAVAEGCSGEFHLAFIPHPRKFLSKFEHPTVKKLKNGEWKDS